VLRCCDIAQCTDEPGPSKREVVDIGGASKAGVHEGKTRLLANAFHIEGDRLSRHGFIAAPVGPVELESLILRKLEDARRRRIERVKARLRLSALTYEPGQPQYAPVARDGGTTNWKQFGNIAVRAARRMACFARRRCFSKLSRSCD